MLIDGNADLNAIEPFETHVEQSGESTVVRLTGELDLNCRRQFEATLQRVASVQAGNVVIDLSGLTFIDSSGLRMILELESQSRRDGFDLSFIRGQGQVRDVLELTGVDDALTKADGNPTTETA